ncbi:hypothetical protein [Labrys wisconsinensis]|uniref:Spy/CpxP family protein refolding chaperone n=1 Tax=Labrys wisconsinensis TaxID=425677 RepID=A0ABU0JG98_9HYPH|nr:hypothetical protein [Labrys wisconsinensis]MDQ0473315.1 Spy/CpxP family protein refolding chaperone [Labrys wisconsinensis]
MKTTIIAACALAFASLASLPAQAQTQPAAPPPAGQVVVHHHHKPHVRHHHRHHCFTKKVRVRHHGHWVWTTKRICR